MGLYMLARATPPSWPNPAIGMHGYDNRQKIMHATFIGQGPAFPVGARPDSFENVNVYLMIACALGLEPAATDGDIDLVRDLMAQDCPSLD